MGLKTEGKLTRRQHWLRDTRWFQRLPFGRGTSRRRTVLRVPELRKRRSERDPVKLREQQAEERHRRFMEINNRTHPFARPMRRGGSW